MISKKAAGCIECDITDTAFIDSIHDSYDYVIHLATVTQSATMIKKPVEVADRIVIGTRNILELAKRCNVNSMVYVSPEDGRVFMQFVKAAYEKRDIVLKTRGQSYGNYCEIYDAIRGIMTILHDGDAGEAYNIVNEDTTMRICEMARMVASKLADGKINVVYDIDESGCSGYAPDTELRLSAEKLRTLGWSPTKTLEDMYRDLFEEYAKSVR